VQDEGGVGAGELGQLLAGKLGDLNVSHVVRNNTIKYNIVRIIRR
jgi:hypothetical protein